MIRSMTGYGRGEYKNKIGHCTVEINSGNHRYCDISVRMPKKFNIFENSVKKLIKERFSRGHFDVFITIDFIDKSLIKLDVDYNLTEDYINALSKVKKRFNIQGDLDLQTISRLKDIWRIEERKQDEKKLWNLTENAIKKAMKSLEDMRIEEGRAIYRDTIKRIKLIKKYLNRVKQRLPKIMDEYSAKLKERIRSLLGELDIDENRFSQEVAIMADKSDVTEEVIRTDNHLDQFLDLIKTEESIGRKLDFLIQEINREINTLSSKVSDLLISNLAIEIKSEMEKVREQVQNVE